MAEIIRASSDQLRHLAASYYQAAKRLESDIDFIREISQQMDEFWEGAEGFSIREQITEKLSAVMQLYNLLEHTSALLQNRAQEYDLAEQEIFRSFFN